MRVISGEAGGRRLKAPPGGRARPTADRVKEALFGALGERVVGARVLDLYAGSGGLGIEALSRGAEAGTFVERDPAAAVAIEENLARTGLSARAMVVRSSVDRFLAHPPEQPFDLVVIDAPYSGGVPLRVLASLPAGGFLAPEAVVVVEVSSATLPITPPPDLELVSQRRYGDSALVWLQRLRP